MSLVRTFSKNVLMLVLVNISPVFAAPNIPDTGQTLQQLMPPMQAPTPSKGVALSVFPITNAVPKRGIQVRLRTVYFTGNTRFSRAVLLAVLGKVSGHQYSFSGLKGLTDRISAYYHAKGYLFARAFLPAQKMGSDTLTIAVVEGRYGTVKATGNKKLAVQADRFLSRLKPNGLIESHSLERAILILEDQPGINIVPIIRPGKTKGSGDLEVPVSRGQRINGNVGLDNQGSRYTGRERTSLNLNINSPFLLGDQITLNGILTTQFLWLGSLGYQLPLGGSGLRANVGYAHTRYKLGKEFSSLDATGYANVSSLGISYPIVRSRKANLSIAVTYQYKILEDKQGATHTQSRKSSSNLPISLNFNLRDSLWRGGITYGILSWTPGKLDLNAGPNRQLDQTTAKTAGHYSKINVGLTRIQALSNHFSLYSHLAAQWANKNLDSSESFGLGGANAVRAYPSGEGYGDEGWLARLELRYATLLNSTRLIPYVFYDSGSVKINHSPWSTSIPNYRRISGVGLGLKSRYKKISINVSLAWHTQGGKPTSSTQNSQPMAWLSLGYGF